MQGFLKKYQIALETLAVFLLAASVRLTSLNTYLVIDEEDRWAWAVAFYRALLAGDLPATLVGDGYPGIFPVWLETLWLMAASLYRSALQGGWIGGDGVYLLIHEWDRTAYLGMQRFPVALANTLLVVLVFLYVRSLFGRWVGLLSALLICFDPFYLSDSRVNRAEGLLTGLMTISLLSGIAFHRWQRHRHLWTSALFGGLALLTKSQALVLLPMFGAIHLVWHARILASPPWRWVVIRQWLGTMTVWVAGVTTTFVLLWPAAWSVPIETFSLMARYATRKVGAEGVKIFFLGQTVLDEDPGPLFYPVIFLLRATPVMLLGLILGTWQLAGYLTRKWRHRVVWYRWLDDAGVWALLAYVLLYVGGMSLGSHKQDRFLMATFPTLYILASIALVQVARHRSWSAVKMGFGVATLLVVQWLTALPVHPYYFAYFNPLVGGGTTAAYLTRIGWGEGMDQVADYLNSQENADQLVVASRFGRYMLDFRGTVVPLDETGQWLQADYIAFYIQQVQRMLEPDPATIRYFQTLSPEHIVRIGGIDYAWIYSNPITLSPPPRQNNIPDKLDVLGLRWESGPTQVKVIWQDQGLAANDQLVARLVNDASDWAGPWQTCQMASRNEVLPDDLQESACALDAAKMPSGTGGVELAVQTRTGERHPLNFPVARSSVRRTTTGDLVPLSRTETVEEAVRLAVPPEATPVEINYGDLADLVAYQVNPDPVVPGQPLQLTLYWQAKNRIEFDLHQSVKLLDTSGNPLSELDQLPPVPTSQWWPGDVISDTLRVPVSTDISGPAALGLDIALTHLGTQRALPAFNMQGEEIPRIVTRLSIPAAEPDLQNARELDYSFDNSLALVAIEPVELESATPGESLVLRLFWRAMAPVSDDYTVFLHVVDASGQVVAQGDGPPVSGQYPTSVWSTGELIADDRQIPLPAELPPGEYQLLVGLYRPSDGQRLLVTSQPGSPDAAPLGSVLVQ
jgi:hypothetical protein